MSAITKADAKGADPSDEEEGGPEDDKPMTFWEHLDELRKRVVRALWALLLGAIAAWTFRIEILAYLTIPFNKSWVEEHVAGDPSLNFATPGGALTAYVKLSLIAGAALASPFVFYQLWSFVAPGLYAREKKYVIPFVFFSSALFVGGGYFGYRAAFPFTFGYFLSLAGDVGGVITIKPTVMMEDYIDFVVQMFLGFGIIFELPILLTFLGMIGVVNHKKLIKFSRYYIFIAFFVAAVLTPPEFTSQLAMAIPAVGLYFLSIGLVYIFQKREPTDESEAEEKKAEEEKKAKSEKKKKSKKTDVVAAEKPAEPKPAETKPAEPKPAEAKAEEATREKPEPEEPKLAGAAGSEAAPADSAPATTDPAGPVEAEPKKDPPDGEPGKS